MNEVVLWEQLLCVFHIRVVILDPQKYIFLIFKNVYLVEVTPPGS